MSNERKKRFEELCAEAAKQLKTTPDNERARHVATLRFMHEQLQIRLIEGHSVDPLALLKLNEAISAHLPLMEMPSVKIEIV